MQKNYKIILVDDHLLLRDALAKLINEFENREVIKVASNGLDMIKLIKEGAVPDLVILDLNMPELDGYGAAEWLSKNHPKIKILILTMYDSEVALIRLLRMGVRGFLKKDINPDDLKAAITSVVENGYYYSNSTTGMLASFFHKNSTVPSMDKALLSELEIEFLKLASSELTYKAIAEEMHLTARSVDGYRDGLFEKLDVKSRVGLVIYAVKNGIVTF